MTSTTLGQINTAFPDDEAGPHSASNEYESGASNPSKSPLSKFNLSFGLSTEKKLKADGQPPKRRGPKPDSKPALTRRQELNRQAQRTHRERKEQYIKCLEQEVLHLKESYAMCAKQRDAWEAEARRLTDILLAHGIQPPQSTVSPLPAHPSSSGSFSNGSYPPNSASTSNTTLPSTGNSYANAVMPPMPNNTVPPVGMPHGQPVTNVDYDQTGIDFVLALEKPCMDHMQMLCVASQQSNEDEISGHALMATCPTKNHLIERPDMQYGHKMPDMQASDLFKLLDLSNRLPLDCEITPIMAWASILRHDYVRFLSPEDFGVIKAELLDKIRCYGFGAVLEEFEVEDAIQNVLSKKTETKFVSAH